MGVKQHISIYSRFNKVYGNCSANSDNGWIKVGKQATNYQRCTSVGPLSDENFKQLLLQQILQLHNPFNYLYTNMSLFIFKE